MAAEAVSLQGKARIHDDQAKASLQSKACAWIFFRECSKIHFIRWLIAFTYILACVLTSVMCVCSYSKCFIFLKE